MSRERRRAVKKLREAAERAVRVGAALKASAARGNKADMHLCIREARAVISELFFMLVRENDRGTTHH